MFTTQIVIDILREKKNSEEFMNAFDRRRFDISFERRPSWNDTPIVERQFCYRKVNADEIINVFEKEYESGRSKKKPPEVYVEILGKNVAKIEEYFKICEKNDEKSK